MDGRALPAHAPLTVGLALVVGLVAWAPLAARAQTPTRVIVLDIAKRAVQGAEVIPGRPVGAVKLLRGDDVVLRWTSDETVTLHLHGYNIEATVTAGASAEMRLQARATGRFAVETHGIGGDRHVHNTLLYVEVHPR